MHTERVLPLPDTYPVLRCAAGRDMIKSICIYVRRAACRAEPTMKLLLHACAAAAIAVALFATLTVAFAQNSPGMPDGVLGGVLPDQFHLKEHPQLEFAASAPSNKYQPDKKSAMRRKGDLGDPNGCNLQCPEDQ